MDWLLSDPEGNPAEARIAEGLCLELEEAIAASGAPEALVEPVRNRVCDMLLNGGHDVIVAVPTIAEGTGHITVAFRLSEAFRGHLTAAASDCVGVALGAHVSTCLH
jgi:hypothetical protein